MALDFLNPLLSTLQKTGSSVGAGARRVGSALAPSPTAEELLAVIPALLGAYEQGFAIRSPLAGVFSTGANLLTQHAQQRRGKSDLASLSQYLDTLPPNSQARRRWESLKPLIAQLSPEEGLRQAQQIETEAASEQIRTPTRFFDPQTGTFVFKHPNDLTPEESSRLLPASGKLTEELYRKAHGIPERERSAFNIRVLDTLARERGVADFDTLSKSDPQAAEEVIREGAKLTSEAQLPIKLDLLRQEMPSKLDLFQQEEALRQKNRVDLINQRSNIVPGDARMRYVRERYNLLPGDFYKLSESSRDATLEAAQKGLAVEAATKTYAETEARRTATAATASRVYASTPIAQTKLFAIDPASLERTGSPIDTVGSLAPTSRFIPTAFQTTYDQSEKALANLGVLRSTGQQVLLTRGPSLLNAAYLAGREERGDPEVNAYRQAQTVIISALRALANTGRVNQTEFKIAYGALRNPSNFQGLERAIGVAQQTIRNGIYKMSQPGSSLSPAPSIGAPAESKSFPGGHKGW